MMNQLQNRLTITPIASSATHGRWRTEAMRSHSSARLMFFSSGQGRITIAGLTRGYGPNNLIFIPPNNMYGYEIGPTVFGQMLTIPKAMAIEWPSIPTHVRIRDVVAQNELGALMDVLERELKSDLPNAARAAHYQLGLLSIYFERQRDLQDVETHGAPSDTPSARLVAAYTGLIEQHFREHLGVANYAAKLGITPSHLTRCCKETCSKSALNLLNDRILFDARLRLRDTKIPVNQIAQDLGYSSAAYFTRAFQAETGLTPSQFRKKGPLAVV